MVIEIWFDYLCPQSYLLHKSLEEAIKIFKDEPIEIRYRNYEMLPGLKNGMEKSLYDVISKHLLVDRHEVERFFENHQNICDLIPYEVIHAHKLSHLAKVYGVSMAFHHQIFHDYYTHAKDISDKNYLKQLALDLGLPDDKIHQVLEGTLYQQQVASNRENAILKGIHRIPHMRINGKQPMYGAQNVTQLLKAFDYALHIEKKYLVCEDESCEVSQ